MVRPGVVELLGRIIPEQIDHRPAKLQSGIQPPFAEGSLVKQQQPVDQEGVVFKIPVQLRLPVLVRAQQPPGLVHEIVEQESPARTGNLPVVVPFQNGGRLGKGGKHEPVPGCKNLVVTLRRHPRRASLQ